MCLQKYKCICMYVNVLKIQYNKNYFSYLNLEMRRLTALILCLLIIGLLLGIAALNIRPLRHFINVHFTKSRGGSTTTKQYSSKELKEHCDENKLILQLAHLNIVSPESIILLLTNKSLRTTCQEVSNVMLHINATLSDSLPLPPGNLYLQLYNGLDYFNSIICVRSPHLKGTDLTNFHDCLQELREDFIECEGPPDWYEKTKKDVVCQYYNDIVNCHYIKTAMLCGLQPALILRTFSVEIMREVVIFKCKVSRSLPHVDDPMPAGSYYTRYYFQFPAQLIMSLFCCVIHMYVVI